MERDFNRNPFLFFNFTGMIKESKAFHDSGFSFMHFTQLHTKDEATFPVTVAVLMPGVNQVAISRQTQVMASRVVPKAPLVILSHRGSWGIDFRTRRFQVFCCVIKMGDDE